jgi:hypothetical protein
MNTPILIHCADVGSVSPEGELQLAALQRAVEKALDKKRRLGQYAVIWQGGKPIQLGENAVKLDTEINQAVK